MASFTGFCFATLFALVFTSSAPAATVAEEFEVGGDEGWRQPASNETEMYARWSGTMRFHIGDSLRFEYINDTVAVVDKWGYYHCNLTHAIPVFTNGNTVIKLERPGPVYFVSANPNHCRNGQRLMVQVMSPHPISWSTTYTSPAPSPSGPSSGARSFLLAPEIVFCYVVTVAFIHY